MRVRYAQSRAGTLGHMSYLCHRAGAAQQTNNYTSMRIILRLALLFVCALLSATGAAVDSARAAVPSTPLAVNWDLTPTQIKASCDAKIAQARTQVKALAAASGPRTFANTVAVFEDINAALGEDLTAQTFLSQVAREKSVRDASVECSNEAAAFGTDETADPKMLAALRAAQHSGTARDVYDKALTDLWIVAFEQSGAGLASVPRAEFVRLSKQLTEIQNRFNQNFANDKTTVTVTPAESAGLPAELLATVKKTAAGSYVIPVNDSTYSPVLQNARNEDVRRRFYIAYGNIQAKTNVALLEQALAIRYRLARLLGYANWAAYQMHTRTVQDPAKIVSFL